jgi:hypothetical protein
MTMPELDDLFISPHAIEQFQQRIALMKTRGSLATSSVKAFGTQ